MNPIRHWAALAVALPLLWACQPEPTPKLNTRSAVTLQNGALVYPADHPQLGLLQTEEVQAAGVWSSVWPARLVWNEDRTQRVLSGLSGRVIRVGGDVGQTVDAGAVLAEVASPDFGQALAEHARARTDWEWTHKQWQRQQELLELGIASQKDLESAQAERQRAQVEWTRAQARLRGYGAAESQQNMALRSALAGVVVERRINPGQELAAGAHEALFVITQPQHLWAWVDVPENEQAGLKPGQTLDLRVASLPGQSFQGRVAALADFINPETRTLRVRLEVPNPQRILKADMLATVRFDRPLGEGNTVAASAVFLESGQHWCFVRQGEGRFVPRQVSVQPIDADRVWVRQGLQTGERVVAQQTLLLAREYRLVMQAARQGLAEGGRVTP